MDPERFQSGAAGRVVQRTEAGEVYWAFVPNPLPPELRVSLASALGRTHSTADRVLGELGGLGRTMPNPHLLIGPFMRREAVLSSRIEGTQADIEDLYVYEAGQLPLPGVKPRTAEADVREVLNYVRALEYGLDRLEELPVSLRLICELHARLMEDVRGEDARPGEFRDRQNWIGAADCKRGEAPFVAPPVDEMHSALDAFEKYLHSINGFPPLIRLALVHYQFEAIHPFIDGNGRIGRLLISLLLVHWELLPSPLLYLSAFFERHRQRYYDLLMAVSERGAWTDWVLFFLQGVIEQCGDALARAKKLQDLQSEWTRKLSRAGAYKARALAELLFGYPVLTVPQVQKLLGLKTYQTARKRVQRLVDAGILVRGKRGPGGVEYVAAEIMRVLTQADA